MGVATTSAQEGNGSLSPNNRFVAYTSNESGEPRIYVRELATGAQSTEDRLYVIINWVEEANRLPPYLDRLRSRDCPNPSSHGRRHGTADPRGSLPVSSSFPPYHGTVLMIGAAYRPTTRSKLIANMSHAERQDRIIPMTVS